VKLLVHGLLFAVFGWAVLQLVDARGARDIVLWFVLAIVLHDLVLLPFYTALDRLGRGLPVPPNAVRIPAALSGLLLLVFFPAILGRNGVDSEGYLERWLLVTALLFAGSLAITVLHLTKKRRVTA
jgi:uncharacterized membrane protein